MKFLTRKIGVLGAKMEPKLSQIGAQNPGISLTFRAILPRRLQGCQMEAKELQNGAKMEPKGSQNGAPSEPRLIKQSVKNKAVECDGDLCLGLVFIRFLMDVHWISNRFW